MAGVFGTNTELQDMKASVQALHIKQYSATASTLALTADYDGRCIALNRAAGIAVTLPAATGSGVKFTILVGTASTAYTIDTIGSDEYRGTVLQTDVDSSDALVSYPALDGDNYDTITLNGTTSGGLVGDRIELVDVASGVWSLLGHVNASGTVVTPLS